MEKLGFTIKLMSRVKEIGDNYKQFGFSVVFDKPECYLFVSFWHHYLLVGYLKKG